MELIWIYGSVILVSLVSLIGITALALRKDTLQRVLLYLVSFAAGALLGDAFIHLIPEASEAGFSLSLSFAILLGIVLSFSLEKVIHWRHCHAPVSDGHPHPFAYMNLFGDFVHNFIDGLIIAASYLVSIPVGIATTLAVLFHEIPQEIGDFGVLVHGGFSRRKAIAYNFLTALSALIGASVAILAFSAIEGSMVLLLGFAAGGFIYIASTDLIPELHKRNTCDSFSRNSLKQLFFILMGIFVMYLLTFLEVAV